MMSLGFDDLSQDDLTQEDEGDAFEPVSESDISRRRRILVQKTGLSEVVTRKFSRSTTKRLEKGLICHGIHITKWERHDRRQLLSCVLPLYLSGTLFTNYTTDWKNLLIGYRTFLETGAKKKTRDFKRLLWRYIKEKDILEKLDAYSLQTLCSILAGEHKRKEEREGRVGLPTRHFERHLTFGDGIMWFLGVESIYNGMYWLNFAGPKGAFRGCYSCDFGYVTKSQLNEDILVCEGKFTIENSVSIFNFEIQLFKEENFIFKKKFVHKTDESSKSQELLPLINGMIEIIKKDEKGKTVLRDGVHFTSIPGFKPIYEAVVAASFHLRESPDKTQHMKFDSTTGKKKKREEKEKEMGGEDETDVTDLEPPQKKQKLDHIKFGEDVK